VEAWEPNKYENVIYGVETLDGGRLIGLVRLHDAEPETGVATLDICSPWACSRASSAEVPQA
jgi:hypothetical protein